MIPVWLRPIARQLRGRAPVEIRPWLPVVTLEPVDLVLANFEARGEAITILQVGACDGTMLDPVRRYLAKGRGRGILIEPNPFAFVRLQRNYAGFQNVTLIQAAIGEQDGEAYLYRVKKSDKEISEVDGSLGIASFYPEHLKRHAMKADEIERITVKCRSLSSLVAELSLGSIDLLQIDAEGFDAAVVRMALKMSIRPSCINFEHRHLKQADRHPLFDLLTAHGYLLGYGAENLLAVRNATLEEFEGGQKGPYLHEEALHGGALGKGA
jgi:FkbM family methyltransferase